MLWRPAPPPRPAATPRSGREPLAALRASTVDDVAAALGGHAGAEPVAALPHQAARLECALHGMHLKSAVQDKESGRAMSRSRGVHTSNSGSLSTSMKIQGWPSRLVPHGKAGRICLSWASTGRTGVRGRGRAIAWWMGRTCRWIAPGSIFNCRRHCLCARRRNPVSRGKGLPQSRDRPRERAMASGRARRHGRHAGQPNPGRRRLVSGNRRGVPVFRSRKSGQWRCRHGAPPSFRMRFLLGGP